MFCGSKMPHLNCYKVDVEHEEGLGRHRDREKKCPKGGREIEKGLETQRLNPEGI